MAALDTEFAINPGCKVDSCALMAPEETEIACSPGVIAGFARRIEELPLDGETPIGRITDRGLCVASLLLLAEKTVIR